MRLTNLASAVEAHQQALEYGWQVALEKRSKQELGIMMFQHFFERYPETRPVFQLSPIEIFAPTKLRIIYTHIVDSVADPDFAADNMFSEIFRHRLFDVYDGEYFYGLIDAFQQVIFDVAAEQLSDEQKLLWSECVQAGKATIQQAFAEVV